MKESKEILSLLEILYDQPLASNTLARIEALIEQQPPVSGERGELFSEDDIVLITYGDSLKREGEAPLQTLQDFACKNFQEIFSTIHILPFFPYSSDDGFSVIDYVQVNPELGTWQEVESLRKSFSLMFDLVLNHISSQSPWFQAYQAGQEGFDNLAIEVDPETDLSQVTRPRALPLLSEYEKSSGEKVHLWTTFSADQIDLNFADPAVLLKMIEVLLDYVQRGARIVRLDAIAYLWKEIGTTCIHLRQTHAVVQLFRKILQQVAPHVIILTETNVPHPENISYLGDGTNEAQMVYNFTLPPLLLHTFIQSDASQLTRWAATLEMPSNENTFFNFTASHDGIGVRPLEGILSESELSAIIERVKANGGRVSVKQNPDGSESPYELNITYIDAMAQPGDTGSDPLHVQRFLASQSIALVLPGVPAVYIHSILGSRNWSEGVEQTGRARTINREKLNSAAVETQLSQPDSFRARVFEFYRKMIQVRRKQPAFHPNAAFQVLDLHPKVFATLRESADQKILTLTNVSPESIEISGQEILQTKDWESLLGTSEVSQGGLKLEPYAVCWLYDRQ